MNMANYINMVQEGIKARKKVLEIIPINSIHCKGADNYIVENIYFNQALNQCIVGFKPVLIFSVEDFRVRDDRALCLEYTIFINTYCPHPNISHLNR